MLGYSQTYGIFTKVHFRTFPCLTKKLLYLYPPTSPSSAALRTTESTLCLIHKHISLFWDCVWMVLSLSIKFSCFFQMLACMDTSFFPLIFKDCGHAYTQHTIGQLNHFEVSFVASSTRKLLYNHHYFQLPKIFITPTANCTISNNSAPPLVSGNYCSVSTYMTIFGSYKWNHILFALLCLAYFTYFHHTVSRDFLVVALGLAIYILTASNLY